METNKFAIGGVVELKPLIKKSEKSGKLYCRLQVVQTRMGGANYDVENKRYYNFVIFDQDVIEAIQEYDTQFHCVVRGNISINYGGKQAFDLNLIGERVDVEKHYDEPFKTLNAKKEKKPIQKEIQEIKTMLDDEDLPF
jgi:hypothetical protein